MQHMAEWRASRTHLEHQLKNELERADWLGATTTTAVTVESTNDDKSAGLVSRHHEPGTLAIFFPSFSFDPLVESFVYQPIP